MHVNAPMWTAVASSPGTDVNPACLLVTFSSVCESFLRPPHVLIHVIVVQTALVRQPMSDIITDQ